MEQAGHVIDIVFLTQFATLHRFHKHVSDQQLVSSVGGNKQWPNFVTG
ncbi:Uncharacterised protein [Vibrio cholerae]|nr:Uncharacterised protein [Vibrio cholerae]CSI72913.1 Uncharacterised protein [Vibrio cholerae]